MKSKENRYLRLLQTIIDKSTRAVGFLIYVIMFAITVQVFFRYGLNLFVPAIVPLVEQSFAIFILVGGVYITSRGGHIRVNVLYDMFGLNMKRFSKVLSLICLVIFMGTLLWQSLWMGLNSLEHGETMNGIYRFMPMYPLKLFIPFMAFLMLIAGIIYFIKTWHSDI